MKPFFLIVIACLFIACSTSKRQIYNADNLPKLSFQQMVEDHDTLVSYIRQTSPIIYFNKEVRNIDFQKSAKRLRSQINEKTTTAQFLQIVEKTLNSAQDWTNHSKLTPPDQMKETPFAG